MASQKTTKLSEPEKVNAYMRGLKHPLADVVVALRQIILKVDRAIGEEIKWNAPTFFYTGEMKPSDPKQYARYLVVFNLYRQDRIRLVFWGGAQADDGSGFLAGDYADGRRLAEFSSLADVQAQRAKLRQTLKRQLQLLDK
ncbi:MAG: DUF1801 domain-containing protein [Anaerolineales bacterium]|nr:DUF1801 domain-containing protein [Anaerolineales bacterium]